MNLLGQGNSSAAVALREHLYALEKAGFKGGIFLIALIGPQDEDDFSLMEFDQFLTGAIPNIEERSLLITAGAETTRTAIVLFAFQ